MVFWVVIGAIVLAEAAIVVAALRMRVVSDSSRGVLGARPAEVVWTLLPVVLVAAVLLLSYEAYADERVAPGAPAGSLIERPLR